MSAVDQHALDHVLNLLDGRDYVLAALALKLVRDLTGKVHRGLIVVSADRLGSFEYRVRYLLYIERHFAPIALYYLCNHFIYPFYNYAYVRNCLLFTGGSAF